MRLSTIEPSSRDQPVMGRLQYLLLQTESLANRNSNLQHQEQIANRTVLMHFGFRNIFRHFNIIKWCTDWL